MNGDTFGRGPRLADVPDPPVVDDGDVIAGPPTPDAPRRPKRNARESLVRLAELFERVNALDRKRSDINDQMRDADNETGRITSACVEDKSLRVGVSYPVGDKMVTIMWMQGVLVAVVTEVGRI